MTPEQHAILNLVTTLRQQDQLIFNMSQCPSWDRMRPFFQELLQGTMQRMRDESDRVRMLMVPEIMRTYATPPQSEDHSPDGHPRLEGPIHADLDQSLREVDHTGDDASQRPTRRDPD